MREPCVAIIERVGVRSSRASQQAEAVGCIFCKARKAELAGIGPEFVVLNGYRAGEVRETSTSLTNPTELISALPLGWPPDWFPKLSMRDAFVLDELAVWFSTNGLATGNFVWHDPSFDEVIRTVWEKRIPVTTKELVDIFSAHGVPDLFHDRIIERFEQGLRLLIWTKSRPPIKNRRLQTFEGISDDPREWIARYGLP